MMRFDESSMLQLVEERILIFIIRVCQVYLLLLYVYYAGQVQAEKKATGAM